MPLFTLHRSLERQPRAQGGRGACLLVECSPLGCQNTALGSGRFLAILPTVGDTGNCRHLIECPQHHTARPFSGEISIFY